MEPKPPAPAACFAQLRDLAKSRLLDGRRHELRNSLAPTHLERLAAEIGEDDLHLATIIVIDRAGRVEAGDAVLQRKSRARTHLDLVSFRNRDREAGRDRVALARSKSVTSSAATTSRPAAPSVA